ncbi:MAG: ABC transporter substrate-binding protein [Clostridia bacterium]
MKKSIALLLCLIMAFSFVACSTNAPMPAEDQTVLEPTEETKTVETEQKEPEHIVFAYMTRNDIPETTELQRIQKLINEYTIEKINTEVELVLIAQSDYSTQINLMLAADEQVDIFRAMNGYPTLDYIRNGSALDITDYLDTDLKDAVGVLYDRLLMPSTVDGRVYGINTVGSNYVPTGWCYRSDIAKELNLDMSSVKDVFALTDIFAQVKQAYPDMIMNDPSRMNNIFAAYLQSTLHMDALGNDAANPYSGVVFGEDSTVVNAFESDAFKELVNLLRTWYQNGYFAKDAATSTATTAELASSGNLFSMLAGLGNPKIASNFTNNYGYPYESIKISDSYMQSYNYDVWMINSSTKVPEAAAKFLNLTFTDEYIHNLLSFGEEGVDYVFDADGFVVPPEGYASLADVPYTCNLNYFMWGSKWLSHRALGGLNKEDFQQNKADNYAAKASYFYGFVYDFSKVQAEYLAVSNIWTEYKMGFWTGSLDVQSALEEMNTRLYAAGLQTILDDKQEQLNTWLASIQK